LSYKTAFNLSPKRVLLSYVYRSIHMILHHFRKFFWRLKLMSALRRFGFVYATQRTRVNINQLTSHCNTPVPINCRFVLCYSHA